MDLMEIFDLIKDNLISIIMDILVVISVVKNRAKTPEQLEKIKAKEITKLEKQNEKNLTAMKANAKKIDELKGVKNA